MAVYLDSASTSFPKPDQMCDALTAFFRDQGVSPGRGAYASAREADELVSRAREQIADYLGCGRPEALSFTPGATFGLNYCIKGSVGAGDHVVTTDTEHNSVLRPLERLKRLGRIDYSVAHGRDTGPVTAEAVEQLLRSETRLIAVNHASNVTGVVNDVEDIIDLAHRHDIPVLVDGSQTTGHLDVDLDALDVDMFCFSAHKGMLGPPGVGGMFVRRGLRLETLIEGGTGNNSQSLVQPGAGTGRYEPGTLNAPGIVATAGSLAYLSSDQSPSESAMLALADRAVAELETLDRVEVFAGRGGRRVPVLAFQVEGLPAAEVAAALDHDHGIETRAGLHCAPLIHRRLGTFAHGLVRASVGHATTEHDIGALVGAVAAIAAGADGHAVPKVA